MPANITNKPVTRAMNDKYLENPEDPEGTPYSTAQIQSHLAASSVVTVYHTDYPKGRIVPKLEAVELRKQGWTDTRPLKKPLPAKAAEPVSELERLRADCTSKGIPFDQRMGVKRLQDMLDAYQEMIT